MQGSDGKYSAEELALMKNWVYCPVCKKGFKSPYFLRRYEIVHTGEKPYVCEYCAASFSQKATLAKHYKAKHFDSVSQTISQ